MLHTIMQPLGSILPPQMMHAALLRSLLWSRFFKLNRLGQTVYHQPRTVMGLQFSNPVGVAPGFDVNGEYIDLLAGLGFGFIEIGTITPRAQLGNPNAIWRKTKNRSWVYQLSGHNLGVEYALANCQRSRFMGVLGVNIGSQAYSSASEAIQDYQYCYRRLYPYVSYIAVNLPDIVDNDALEWSFDLLATLKQSQSYLSDQYGRYVPIVFKLPFCINKNYLLPLLEKLHAEKCDGLGLYQGIPMSKANALPSQNKLQLVGEELKSTTEEMLSFLHKTLQGTIPLICSGGILSVDDAVTRFHKGANLIQLYSGILLSGKKILKQLASRNIS